MANSQTSNPAPWDLLSSAFGDGAMNDLFGEATTISCWLQAERALARAEASCGVLSETDATAIERALLAAPLDTEVLWEQTRNVGYPIFPLVRMLTSNMHGSPAGKLHYGATTQDIMDTGLVLQLRGALERLEQLLGDLGDTLAELVSRHEMTVMAARTHGQQAVPTTFGAKLAALLAECARHRGRLGSVRERILVVSLYGAGGTSAALGPRSEQIRSAMAEELGLRVAPVPWHVARDELAEYGSLCAMLAATAARFAREVIELSRTEIGELGESGGHHRGASSTMPQKANPIASETVVGFAGAAQAVASALFGIMQPPNERAAGEWQSEWFVVPTLSRLAAGALKWADHAARDLRVFPEAMERNLSLDGGLILAEAYMIALAPTLGREQAHDVLYQLSLANRAEGTTLLDSLAAITDPGIRAALDAIGELRPSDYLGEAVGVSRAAVAAWMQSRLQ